MAATFVLPLFPLEDSILLPGEQLCLPATTGWTRSVYEHAHGFGDAVVASLMDGEAVHEVAVTALVSGGDGDRITLKGVSRCRLLGVVSEEVPLVRAERVREPVPGGERADALSRLLLARFTRLRHAIGKPPGAVDRDDLSTLTWRVTAELGLTLEQQQGFLNVVDPLTRGKLLLTVLRDLERRERFLRPFARLRTETPWS